MAMLDEAERNLVNLMRKSAEHSDLSVERFSIGRITDRYGNYTDNGIILDNISLEEFSVEQRQEFIKNFVKNTLRGRQFIVTNPAGETEILEIADKKREYKKDTSKNARKAINKLALFKNKSYIRNLAILHIDEIVDNSSYAGKSSRNTHGDFDRNGWNYRLAYLQDKNGRIYRAILNIAKTTDGKNIIYDIKLDEAKKIAEAALNPALQPVVRSASADYNISNSGDTVNTSAQTRQENITKDNKNIKATGKATGLTIELVMMITRVVIIIKKPIIE